MKMKMGWNAFYIIPECLVLKNKLNFIVYIIIFDIHRLAACLKKNNFARRESGAPSLSIIHQFYCRKMKGSGPSTGKPPLNKSSSMNYSKALLVFYVSFNVGGS